MCQLRQENVPLFQCDPHSPAQQLGGLLYLHAQNAQDVPYHHAKYVAQAKQKVH